MTQKIIAQGAEAVIKQNKNQVTKQRISKSYRIPQIDEKIRKLRTRNEAKIIELASSAIPVPGILESDEKSKEIVMDFIEGKKLSTNLDNLPLKQQLEICKQIGQNTAKIHQLEIIHGDLTTSNMILSRKDNKVFLIDFGLAFRSSKYEDKAVDLHLLRQALEAKHFKNWQQLFDIVKQGYQEVAKNEADKVLNQLIKVEKRGRYKH